MKDPRASSNNVLQCALSEATSQLRAQNDFQAAARLEERVEELVLATPGMVGQMMAMRFLTTFQDGDSILDAPRCPPLRAATSAWIQA